MDTEYIFIFFKYKLVNVFHRDQGLDLLLDLLPPLEGGQLNYDPTVGHHPTTPKEITETGLKHHVNLGQGRSFPKRNIHTQAGLQILVKLTWHTKLEKGIMVPPWLKLLPKIINLTI